MKQRAEEDYSDYSSYQLPAGTVVLARREFQYDRDHYIDRGEIFELKGKPNDARLIGSKTVARHYAGAAKCECGRRFVNKQCLEHHEAAEHGDRKPIPKVNEEEARRASLRAFCDAMDNPMRDPAHRAWAYGEARNPPYMIKQVVK